MRTYVRIFWRLFFIYGIIMDIVLLGNIRADSASIGDSSPVFPSVTARTPISRYYVHIRLEL